jgi:hypothetical protein
MSLEVWSCLENMLYSTEWFGMLGRYAVMWEGRFSGTHATAELAARTSVAVALV